MNKNTAIILAVVALLVGHGTGYLMAKNNPHNKNIESPNVMNHNVDNMPGAMDSMVAGLQGKTGDEFDKAFIDGMIMHHEGAVLMAQMALKSASHQEIKDMANAIISAQTKEINQMKSWKATWFTN